MSALRRVQERLQFKSAHKRNFSPYGRKTKKQSKSDTWMAKFVCLANKDQTSIPLSVTDKIDLIEAGLGEKKIQIDLNYATMQFQSKILNEFPKLEDAGGFELLRCIPNTKKLESISSIVCKSPKLLKSVVGSGRIFIRPIQKSLCLTAVTIDLTDSQETEVSFVIYVHNFTEM